MRTIKPTGLSIRRNAAGGESVQGRCYDVVRSRGVYPECIPVARSETAPGPSLGLGAGYEGEKGTKKRLMASNIFCDRRETRTNALPAPAQPGLFSSLHERSDQDLRRRTAKLFDHLPHRLFSFRSHVCRIPHLLCPHP
jgi:hypothetical protein